MRGIRSARAAAFLVGLAGALAAELAAGLLLYAADGFLEAVTLVLAVGLGALGTGLVIGRVGDRSPAALRGLRRRWLLALLAFGAAGAVSMSWSLELDPPSSPLGRGMALALLEAFPLYTVGLVLGGIGGTVPAARAGGWAALGAAAGVVLQGTVLLTRLQPFSVHLLGVVLLSAAALLHGRSVERTTSMTRAPDDPTGPAEEEFLP